MTYTYTHVLISNIMLLHKVILTLNKTTLTFKENCIFNYIKILLVYF